MSVPGWMMYRSQTVNFRPAPSGATCDKCGPAVMAAVQVTLASLLTLDFCNHHAEAYKAKLLATAGENVPS